jgi:quercetin dioxygenase-like cupin family protein
MLITRRDVVVAIVTACATLGVAAFSQAEKSLLGSSVFDWNAVSASPQKYGARRQFFQSPTATVGELECHATTLKPGEAANPPHRHPEEAVVIVKEGTVEALVNGEWRRAGPGSVIFEATNQLHGVRNVGQTPATYHVVKWLAADASKAQVKP